MVEFIGKMLGISLFATSGYLLLRQYRVLGILLILGSIVLLMADLIFIAMYVNPDLQVNLTLSLLMTNIKTRGEFLISGATLGTVWRLTFHGPEVR